MWIIFSIELVFVCKNFQLYKGYEKILHSIKTFIVFFVWTI